ncbi:MAG: peptidase [Oscillochloris sp.]|nr:peptidase [Oscillochloris sp.]
MSPRTHLRNAAIAALVVTLLFMFANVQIPAAAAPVTAPEQAPLAQDLVNWQNQTLTVTVQQGNTAQFTNRLNNNIGNSSTVTSTFDIDIVQAADRSPPPSGLVFTVIPDPAVVNQNGGFRTITFVVNAASNLAAGSYTLLIRARLEPAATSGVEALAALTINVTALPTSTPTPTGSPQPVCADGFEPDDNPASATVLDVQTSQLHTICPAGDEDWLVFGGVGGKTYTIDVSRMDPGIDLTLELFDPELNSIAFNDDFFNRDPSNPNPTDIKPRITITIPYDGSYYIRVRDAAGSGGENYFYVIALIDESYGPTPTLVAAVCLDLFEPDGLPEQANLLTSNELQEDRKLCPTGDADWITFFGKAGKRYVLFTDTRRYRGRNEVNGETQAGADTVIVLTDRDGVSVLDVNDDIPGGNTLDSEIEFVPEVDGFYFLQIKNVGDIGNQFIRYDLTLLLCLPEQTSCGRAGAPANRPTSQPAGTPAPTGTPIEEFPLDDTPTPTPTNTPEP